MDSHLINAQYNAYVNCLKMFDRRGYSTISGKMPSTTQLSKTDMRHITLFDPDDHICYYIDDDQWHVVVAFKDTENLTRQDDLIRMLLSILKQVDPSGSYPTASKAKVYDLIRITKEKKCHPIIFYHNNHSNLDNVQQIERKYAFSPKGDKVQLEIFQMRFFQFDIFSHSYQPKMTRLSVTDPEIVALKRQYVNRTAPVKKTFPRTGIKDMAARYYACNAREHYLKVERPGELVYRKIILKKMVDDDEDDEYGYDSASDDDDDDHVDAEADMNPETSNMMTNYEYARLLGVRAEQLARGAPCNLNSDEIEGITDVLRIAAREIKLRKCPLMIRRNLPNGKVETFRLVDMILPGISSGQD